MGVPLTHEYLALMLGIRQAGVTTALHELEGEKLIRAGRDHITVVDRAGLEARSCGCYAMVTEEAKRVLGAAGSSIRGCMNHGGWRRSRARGGTHQHPTGHSRARGEHHPGEEHQTNSADRREEQDKVAIGLRSGRTAR